jgi:hypothetical protein
VRDHVADQGGEPRSITLNNALGDEELAILAVLRDRLEECTDLILSRHRCGEASDRPFINDADLLVKLGAVLVPVPVPGLPFIAHLLDHISREIALEAGSVDAHELAFAGKIRLSATLLYLALPGDKMNLPRRVGKRDPSQVKHYGIIAAEHIASAIGPQAGLPFGYDLVVTTAQMVGFIKGHNGSMDTTTVVRLFELEKVRA